MMRFYSEFLHVQVSPNSSTSNQMRGTYLTRLCALTKPENGTFRVSPKRRVCANETRPCSSAVSSLISSSSNQRSLPQRWVSPMTSRSPSTPWTSSSLPARPPSLSWSQTNSVKELQPMPHLPSLRHLVHHLPLSSHYHPTRRSRTTNQARSICRSVRFCAAPTNRGYFSLLKSFLCGNFFSQEGCCG